MNASFVRIFKIDQSGWVEEKEQKREGARVGEEKMIMQGRSLFVDQIRMSQIQEKKSSKKTLRMRHGKPMKIETRLHNDYTQT